MAYSPKKEKRLTNPGINDLWTGVIEATGDKEKEIKWRNILVDLEQVAKEVEKLPKTNPDLSRFLFNPKHEEPVVNQTSL